MRPLWVAALALLPTLLAGQQTKPKTLQGNRKALPPAVSASPAVGDDLTARIGALRSAVQSGDPAAVEASARNVAAAALRQMAVLSSTAGDLPKAIGLYRQSLDLKDANDVRPELATAYGANNQPDNAIEEAEKVVITDPASSTAWALKGKAYMGKADFQRAVDSLVRSLALKRDVNLQYALAFSYLKLKQKDKARAVFQEMLRDYGDRAIWHEVFAGAYRENKELDDALREFEVAIKMDPTLPHIHAFYGATLLEKNYWAPNAEILAEFSEEAKVYPKGYFGHFYLGVLLSQQGQLEEANPHLKQAIEANPTDPDPWLYLGLNYFKLRDNANAKAALLKAVELTGDDQARANYQIRRAYIALGRILVTQGDRPGGDVYMKKARELSDKALAVSSSAIAAEMAEGAEGGLGSAPAVVSDASLRAAGLPQGETGAQGLTSQTPESPRLTPEQRKAIEAREKELKQALGSAFNDWGTSEARQRNYASALGRFREGEKWDPSTPDLMRNLGLAAFRLGDNREAARALQIAVQQSPQDQAARGMLAMALFSSQQYAEAVKAFDGLGDAVNRDPRMTYAYAFALAHAGELNKSVEVLKQLAQQSLPSDMMMAIADLFSQTGDLDDALKGYQKVIQQDPTLSRAHYYAGDMLIKLGRPDEAIAMFEQEMKLTPNDSNVEYHYAYALLQTSRKDEAVVLLQKITAAQPDHAQAQYQLGKALLDKGQYQEAIEHLEAAAKYDPNHDYIHYQLQAAYRKAGRTTDADRELAIYKSLKDQAREKGNPQPN